MKHSNRNFLFALLFVSCLQVAAQDRSKYNWQLGLGIGYTNYYGDLSNYRIHNLGDLNKLYRFADYNKNYINQPSFTLTLHKKITPAFGIMLQANHHSFGMSDRYQKKNGSFDSSSVNYARSLNFRTRLQDAGIAFTFHTNTGKMFSKDAFFYPSIYFGTGVSKFVVKGDLYDENGNPYNYRLSGNINDGIYETNLRDLQTETDGRYPNVIPYVDLGLGLNFRFNEMLTVSIQSDIKYSASDYLDDVSARYKDLYSSPEQQYAAKPGYNTINPVTLQRGDDNSINDFYINNRVVFTIDLPNKYKSASKIFNSPVIYALGMPYRQKQSTDSLQALAMRSKQDSLLAVKLDSLRKKDSVYAAVDTVRVATSLLQGDSTVQRQLQFITNELQEIKVFLKEQELRPRYQQLQFQDDSIRRLRNLLKPQRAMSREDNLRLRIYDLQLDSIKNEMERVQWNRNPDARKDSAVRYNPVVSERDTVNAVLLRQSGDTVSGDTVSGDTVSNKPQQYVVEASQASADTVVLNDTIIYRPDTKRIDSLQRKLYELQQRVDARDTAVVTVDTTVNEENTLRFDTAAYNQEMAQLQTRLQQNADSVALLQNRLKRSNDSAAYYRRISFAATEGTAIVSDTVVEKKKWPKRLFESKKKKDRETEKVNITKRSLEQERYYNEDVNRLQIRMEELERRNRQLQEDQKLLDQRRTRRNEVSETPVVIYDRNGNERVSDRDYNELVALRTELDRLRNEINATNQRNYVNERNNQVPDARADSIIVPVSDTAHIRSMRSELDRINMELESLRKYQAPVIKNEPEFNINNFPVISVYFNTGSASLTRDQASKITPFGNLAVNNSNVKIMLKGFTDPVGNPLINARLAGKRSAYVKNLLVSKFNIEASRITIEEPSSGSGKSKKANPLDRRVDLQFE